MFGDRSATRDTSLRMARRGAMINPNVHSSLTVWHRFNDAGTLGANQRLFHAALELEPGLRLTFLAEACAQDALLRHEVESLLMSHEQAESFIETPAAELRRQCLPRNSLLCWPEQRSVTSESRTCWRGAAWGKCIGRRHEARPQGCPQAAAGRIHP